MMETAVGAILSDFNVFSETLPKDDPFRNERAASIKRFGELGFPTTKNEEWKYTNIALLAKTGFQLADAGTQPGISAEDIKEYLLGGKDAPVIVFVNGRYNASLTRLNGLEKKITVRSLAASLNEPVVKKHLGKYASIKTESLIALNTAFLLDGAFIHVPDGAIVEESLHILYISDSWDNATVAYPRNLVVAEQRSAVKITESYHSHPSANPSFVNSVTEVIVKENAKVELNKVQHESAGAFHINHTEAYQMKDSTFNITTITLGGDIVRNNLHIVLDAENCTTHLNGLYLLDDSQLVDNHTLVDHAKPNCYSNELYKGIIDGKAQGVFNGKIFVRKDAQKTNAYQSNKNILLSDHASMNAKPQLEIFADDVKCSHGATTGQLDEEALFYLRSRGIGEENAKALLNVAFAADVLRNITPEVLKNNLSALIAVRLNKSAT